MEAAAKKLQAAGVPCGFTTEWPSWAQIENLSAWHNVPIATKANGFGGLDTELKINGPLQVRHLANLAEWQKSKLFDYGGRGDSAKPKFYSGECGMTMASSGARLGIITNMKAEVGIGMLPYWPDVAGAPQNSIIGGATLWVLKGQKPAEYKGVARFFAYLSKPDVQAWWHQETGYLPITQAAYELSRKQGFYDKNPGADVAIKQMTLNPPTGEFQGPAARQLRADPQRHRGGDRERAAGQEERQGSARQRGGARQRSAAAVREGQHVGVAAGGFPPVVVLRAAGPHAGQARQLSGHCRAARAARAAARHHVRLLRVAERAVAAWLAVRAGCLRPLRAVRRRGEFRPHPVADPAYLSSFGITIVFAAGTTALAMGIALVLAVLADRAVKGASTYKPLITLPYAVAPAIAGVLWWFLFNPTIGVLPRLLAPFGIVWNHFLNGDQALILVTIASAWKQVSYNFLFFLAGLQTIPQSLLDAAEIDGADGFARFRLIVLPLLMPTTFFLSVINLVYAFCDTFAVIHATTSGGPGNATTTLVYKVFRDGFETLDLGGSAAQSVVLLVIVGALTVAQFRYIERNIHY